MKSFNLSDWALHHRSLVWYFMIAFMAAGLFAYLQLGRQEDPDFTIKTMVIQAQWPGASPEEMTRQVTDRIEKKLEELESLDYTKSVTIAGAGSSATTTPSRARDRPWPRERCARDRRAGAPAPRPTSPRRRHGRRWSPPCSAPSSSRPRRPSAWPRSRSGGSCRCRETC